MRTFQLFTILLGAALLASSAYAEPYEIENQILKLPGPVVFKTGAAELAPESDAILEHVKGFLGAKEYVSTLRIEVHTDNVGDPARNQALSEQRALAVARALVQRGVDCARLLPVGFGADKPIAPNDTPENRAANRRTAFVMAALRGRAIGGMPTDGGGRVAGDPCK